MLSAAKPIAFITTSQPELARKFYENVLGLEFVADEPYALVFRTGGIMLRVAKAEKVTVAPYTVLGWKVEDIAASVRELANSGVAFEIFPGMGQDKSGIWTSPSGAKIAWFKDPDGHMLSLTEFSD
jgi:catechol 2,3-dioxygenase-like lactoylglutathione lyase family enzyme